MIDMQTILGIVLTLATYVWAVILDMQTILGIGLTLATYVGVVILAKENDASYEVKK